MLARCVLVLPLVVACHGSFLRATQLSEAQPIELCTRDGVTVLWSSNKRMLRFAADGSSATETTVHCKGDDPSPSSLGECQSNCGACACHFDSDIGLTSSYMRTMFQQLQSLCSSSQSTRVLSIGLGGAELPQYLLNQCPQMTIEAVELNGGVIRAARDFFGLHQSEELFKERISVEQADALEAVEQRQETTYDAVLIDCFSGGGMVPESCRSDRMALGVHNILKPSGMLLQNIWHYSPKHPEVADEFRSTVQIYDDFFPGSVEDLAVPMKKGFQWVDILKATKKS